MGPSEGACSNTALPAATTRRGLRTGYRWRRRGLVRGGGVRCRKVAGPFRPSLLRRIGLRDQKFGPGQADVGSCTLLLRRNGLRDQEVWFAPSILIPEELSRELARADRLEGSGEMRLLQDAAPETLASMILSAVAEFGEDPSVCSPWPGSGSARAGFRRTGRGGDGVEFLALVVGEGSRQPLACTCGSFRVPRQVRPGCTRRRSRPGRSPTHSARSRSANTSRSRAVASTLLAVRLARGKPGVVGQFRTADAHAEVGPVAAVGLQEHQLEPAAVLGLVTVDHRIWVRRRLPQARRRCRSSRQIAISGATAHMPAPAVNRRRSRRDDAVRGGKRGGHTAGEGGSALQVAERGGLGEQELHTVGVRARPRRPGRCRKCRRSRAGWRPDRADPGHYRGR